MTTKTHYSVELRLSEKSWMEVSTGHDKVSDARAAIKRRGESGEHRVVRVETKRTVVR